MVLLLIMLGVLALVLGCALILMARAILTPPRMTDGKAIYLLKRLSPADLGMQFDDVRFVVRDHPTGEIKLAAWWIPHPAGGDKTVLLIHGYADAKVGAIAWAPTWRALGFHILGIDLRAHGESGGKYSTAGVFERADLDQVLNQLRASHPSQTRQIVLFGISFGASVALAVAEQRDDIQALVLECPFGHFRRAVRTHARMLELPLPSLLPAALRVAQWMSGADFDTVDPIRAIHQVKCPVMVIQSTDDPFVAADDALQIRQAVESRTAKSLVWQVPGVAHLLAVQADPELYRSKIEEFLRSIQ